MQPYQISNDDIEDVKELTDKLETCINDILKDIPLDLSMSAFMSASINVILYQSENIDELIKFKNCFMLIIDSLLEIINKNGNSNGK